MHWLNSLAALALCLSLFQRPIRTEKNSTAAKTPENITNNTKENIRQPPASKLSQPQPITYIVYNYTGRLGFNEKCMSDSHREYFLQTNPDNLTFDDKLEHVDKHSCNISKFLECRTVTTSESRNQEIVPVSRCLCPDYERFDSVNKFAYFDPTLDSCVLKVRGKCANYFLPSAAQRFITPAAEPVIDNRFQPGLCPVCTVPCVKNAYCNVFLNDPRGPDNRDQRFSCTCRYNFLPKEDGECYEIPENSQWGRNSFIGFIILAIPFFVFFAMEGWDDCDKPLEYRGSREQVVVLGEHFQKKAFPNTVEIRRRTLRSFQLVSNK